jgi:hypothetical protein
MNLPPISNTPILLVTCSMIMLTPTPHRVTKTNEQLQRNRRAAKVKRIRARWGGSCVEAGLSKALGQGSGLCAQGKDAPRTKTRPLHGAGLNWPRECCRERYALVRVEVWDRTTRDWVKT